MKTIFPLVALLMALNLTGCAWFRHESPHAAPANGKPSANASTNSAVAMAAQHAQAQQLTKPTIVTPDTSLAAKVVAANDVGRFVIMSFPAEQLPKMNQTLFLYRAGLKVAEVKVTGPQSDNNIVADLVSGEARVGDTVRAE